MVMKAKQILITGPAFQSLPVRIEGITPLMMNKFSNKARMQIESTQTAKDKTKRKRDPKDYAAEFNAARYVSTEGWDGIPAATIRNAMIAACRLVDGLPMTRAKSLIFVRAQGRDSEDGTSLLRIIGKAVHDTRPVRLESGVTDLRNRPRYDEWAAEFEIEYDSDQLSETDVANLLARAGLQGGIGELRPQAPNSFGGDFGTFRVMSQQPKRTLPKGKLKVA